MARPGIRRVDRHGNTQVTAGSGEGYRSSKRRPLLSDFVQDVGFALRALRRQPGFVAAAVLTLALGIGANVAMFGVVNLALFRALPFADADRLVLGRTRWPGGGIRGIARS